VVGDGHGRHPEVLGFLHEGVNLVGPVKQTILGVDVEVNELGRHEGIPSILFGDVFYRRVENEVNQFWREARLAFTEKTR